MKTSINALICSIAAALVTAPVTAAEVEMHTSEGLLRISVDEKNAPLTAANFLQYVREGFFDGLVFHRVIPGFVIQGGGFTSDLTPRKNRATIKNEATNGLKNLKYTLSMARTNDPNSATSQFFINLNDNQSLDYDANNPGYAVFAKVVEGQQVVDAIAIVATHTVGHYQDVPKEPIIIEKAIVK